MCELLVHRCATSTTTIPQVARDCFPHVPLRVRGVANDRLMAENPSGYSAGASAGHTMALITGRGQFMGACRRTGEALTITLSQRAREKRVAGADGPCVEVGDSATQGGAVLALG